MNLRDEILEMKDALIEPCPVPEWGEIGKKLFIRTMDGATRDAWESAIYTSKQQGEEAVYENVRARLAAATLCDENGNLIFAPSDARALGKKSSTALRRVFDAAMRLNKLGKEDVEELTKNSTSEANAVSGSVSPSPSGNQ